MGIFELFVLAVGLSMDAFAVSVCKGLATKQVKIKHMAIAGAWFGIFQALMPTIGFLLGSAFEKYINRIDHWVAFILLAIIGGNMIRESLSDEDEKVNSSFGFKTMFVMAVATSIDALASGIAFAALNIGKNIIYAVLFIGVITFILSAIGVKIGSIAGAKYKNKAELTGGCILVLLGLKILLEHLGVISF